MTDRTDAIKAVKHLYWFFVIAAIISFLYAILTNRLNGDFLGVEVKLPWWMLFVNLVFTILPFFFTWRLYLYFKRKPIERKVTIPVNIFGYFLVAIIIWNAVVTIIYGVGVLAAPPYEAPPIIKPIIQVMNRFNYMYGAFIYILVVPKKNKFQFFLVILLLLLAYLRSGLGVLMYFGMLYYIKYFIEVNIFFKKHKLVVIISLLVFPIFVSGLYELRSILRNQQVEEVASDPIFGVLFGRLSSFSDSAFILQEAPYFFIASNNLDPLYFQKQALGGVISVHFMPEVRPELMLFQFFYENSEDNVAYMAGTQGNLYFSLFKSPTVFLLNILTIFIYIISTFYLFRLLRFKYSNELASMLLLYVLMSGVSNEYAFLVFSVFVYVMLFLIINLMSGFKNNKIDENSLYTS
jgi:hypothetical protein